MGATMKKANVLAQVQIKAKGKVDIGPIRGLTKKPVPQGVKALLDDQAQLKLGGKDNTKTYYKVGPLEGKDGLHLRIKVKDKDFADYQLLKQWTGEAADGPGMSKALKGWVDNRKTVLALLEGGKKAFAKKVKEAEDKLDHIEEIAAGYAGSTHYGVSGDGTRDKELKKARADKTAIDKILANLNTHHDRTYFPQYKRTFREGTARKREANLTDPETKPYNNQMNDALRAYNAIKDLHERCKSISEEAANAVTEAETFMNQGAGAVAGMQALAKKVADLAEKEQDAVNKAWGLEQKDSFLRQLTDTFGRVVTAKGRLDEAEEAEKATREDAFETYLDSAAVKMQKVEDAIKASGKHIKKILAAERDLRKIPRNLESDLTVAGHLTRYEDVKSDLTSQYASWDKDIKKARKAFTKLMKLKAV